MRTAPEAALAAGIFGRSSGNHVIQIAIVSVVGLVLIGYFGWQFISTRSREREAESRRERSAGAEPTLRLSRTWSGMGLGGRTEGWDIAIDDKVVGSIEAEETVDIAVTPGAHTFRLGQGRHLSRRRSFEVAAGEVVMYRCHGPRFWPLLLAALIKSDLWITLTRV